MKKTLTVSFVIGSTASGKSSFIEQNFADMDVVFLNVFDFQKQAFDEVGVHNKISMHEQIRCLLKANDRLLEVIIENLQQGKSVVCEHTFLKAKRRITYIEAIREAVSEVLIDFYVMQPSDETYKEYLKKRDLLVFDSFEYYKDMLSDLEFPNIAEGFDQAYEVVDNTIILRIDPPKPELVDKAHKELIEESERIRAEDEKKKAKKELLESLKHRPFWHTCECCGKAELLTAKQAFDEGWDYPPTMGCFGVLGPRTCGNCSITDTLYWKIQQQGLPVLIKKDLNSKEMEILNRIENEPECLLKQE